MAGPADSFNAMENDMIDAAAKVVRVLALAATMTALVACDKTDPASAEKGPAERVGAQIDKATAKAGEELNKVAEQAGKGLEKAGEKLQQTAQEAQKKEN